MEIIIDLITYFNISAVISLQLSHLSLIKINEHFLLMFTYHIFRWGLINIQQISMHLSEAYTCWKLEIYTFLNYSSTEIINVFCGYCLCPIDDISVYRVLSQISSIKFCLLKKIENSSTICNPTILMFKAESHNLG